jgi:hypothetical protein
VVTARQEQDVLDGDPVSGVHVQAQAQVDCQNYEQAAREAGHRWGLRQVALHGARNARLGNWPGTLEECRQMVDALVGRKIGHDERELLAMLVERAARRAWHTRAAQALIPE